MLIPPENVELLATSMAYLMRNSDERARMGTMARRLTESEFSAERMSDDYLCLYQNLMPQNRNPGGTA
jgi:glycosyltransferase involved in cell wall biosynthesis